MLLFVYKALNNLAP